jgi:hypothetical protein
MIHELIAKHLRVRIGIVYKKYNEILSAF